MFRLKYVMDNEIHDAMFSCRDWEWEGQIDLLGILNYSFTTRFPSKIYFLVREGKAEILFSVKAGELIETPQWLAEKYKR